MNAVHRASLLHLAIRSARPIWFLAVLLCLSSPLGVSIAGRDAHSLERHLARSTQSLAPASQPVNISVSATHSRAPAVAVAVNRVHVVWEEGNRVYHRASSGGVWSSTRSMATGEQPAIVMDSSGVAHTVFVNEFNANYEIYYCRWNGLTWTLPRNVSNTSGVSSAPSIAIESNGKIHVVWADNTPGYSIIYHAYWDGTYWLNEPVPHAMGGAPAVAVSAGGVVDVVWQDRDAAELPYEIYHSQWDGEEWSLPENLSDSVAAQSISPNIAMSQDGEAHVTWQERVGGRYAVYYTYGRVGYWSIPEQISEAAADAYLPSAVVRTLSQGNETPSGGTVYVGWDESTLALYRSRSTDSGTWSPPSTVLAAPLGVADLQLAVDAGGLFHAVWSERVTADNWEVFYQCLSKMLVLPVILKRLSP